MLFNQIFSSLALLSLSAAAAVSSPKVLSLPLNRKARDNTTASFEKRAADVDVNLINKKYYYSVDIALGTPGQTVSVLVDTGSSDLWVDKEVYNPKKSSAFKDTRAPFRISYGDGSSASGTYVKDTITLAGATLKDGNFAYATQSDAGGVYVFGVGLPTGEAAQTQYDNYPLQLKKQGLTESAAYSLWLNDFNDAQGNLLFGGVDHALYKGELGLLPIVRTFEVSASQPPGRLVVNLNSIGVSKNGKSGTVVSGAAAPVLLDSGTTYGVLPDDWIKAIAATLGATFDNEVGFYITTNKPTSGTLDLNFSGVTVNNPLDAFLRPVTLNDGSTYQKNGKDAYLLAVQGAGNGLKLDSEVYILGDAFLAGAYIAFDLENYVIGIANANLGDISGSDIEAIGSGGIPGTKASGYATATNTHASYTLHTPTGLA